MAALSPNDRPCGAGVNTVSVDPRGEVYPCLPMRTSLGSIRVQPFAKIWRDSPGLSQIRSLTLADLERCNDCDLRQHCNRCAGFAVAEGKGVNGHCAFDCLMARVVSKEV